MNRKDVTVQPEYKVSTTVIYITSQ